MHEHERRTMNEHSGRRGEATTAEPQPEPEARDIDVLRLELAHKLQIYRSNERALWRTCDNTACGRARSCVAPDGKCPHLPSPPYDPQAFAEGAAKFKKALERRCQAMLREEEAARRAAAAPKAPAARGRRNGRRG